MGDGIINAGAFTKKEGSVIIEGVDPMGTVEMQLCTYSCHCCGGPTWVQPAATGWQDPCDFTVINIHQRCANFMPPPCNSITTVLGV